jgi:nucleolar protein 58
MARIVATKAALSIRVDALTDADSKSDESASSIGVENRAKLEKRLLDLESQADFGGIRPQSYNNTQKFEMTSQGQTYNTKADVVMEGLGTHPTR